ncbi:MAG: alpha/beta fold hydrolase, partial [Opitutaceae bacterium]
AAAVGHEAEDVPSNRIRLAMTKTMPVLAHRDFGGEGRPPLIILHGLLGSSRNWQSAGRDLAEHFHVHALDLRNHGDSFHAREMDYPAMAMDVAAWMGAHGIERARLIGHSMGGKVGMVLACRFPQRLEKFVAVDIAPRAYPAGHVKEFEAMHALDLDTLGSRQEAEAAVELYVSEWGMRQFLLSNLERKPDGGFRWMINLQGITDALSTLEDEFLGEGDRFDGEVLFLLGGRSKYFKPEDRARVKKHFPAAKIETMPSVGHNPHFEAREAFVAEVMKFLGAP